MCKHMKNFISVFKVVKGLAVLLFISLFVTGCFSNDGKRRTTGEEPFFQREEGLAEHGKKKTLDRIYQIDPGGKEFKISDKFYTDPPRKIAILPFDNLVGGKYILNSVPIPRFSKKETDGWNWTYSNRLRRFFFGHFASREFVDIELMYVDKMLQELEILTPNDLYKIPAQELGEILGADALIYGQVTKYKNSYYALFKQIKIGLSIKCVSTKDGSILFEGEQRRHDNDIRVATNPIDFVIASFQNFMSMRDVYAARASEEVVRELVIRIPIINSFIEEEEQRIKEKIKARLSVLPTVDTTVADKDNDGDTASQSILDKTESRTQEDLPDTLIRTGPVGS
ncbi:GNA1162 family protein [Candidatus Scalindua japonica]|nr:GNA1162 family protein [Candidatus Scalindua japonica]